MNLRGRAGTRGLRAGPPERSRVYLMLLVALLVGGLIAAPVHADDPSGHSPDGSSEVAVGVLLLAAAGLGFAATRRRGRQVAILSLGLLVGLFGVESAIHSVHHFSDPQSAASCALFSASQHAHGAGSQTVATGIPTWTAQPSPTFDAEEIRPLQAFRSHEGRAPPVLPSA